jgi:hypothetical protein
MPVNISTCRVLVFYKAGYLRTILLCAIFYLFIFLSTCFAQKGKIDSLKKVLPSLNDTDRIDCLNELSYCYTYISKKDSAEYYATVAENESKNLNYIHGIAESVSRQAGMAEHFENNFFKEE